MDRSATPASGHTSVSFCPAKEAPGRGLPRLLGASLHLHIPSLSAGPGLLAPSIQNMLFPLKRKRAGNQLAGSLHSLLTVLPEGHCPKCHRHLPPAFFTPANPAATAHPPCPIPTELPWLSPCRLIRGTLLVYLPDLFCSVPSFLKHECETLPLLSALPGPGLLLLSPLSSATP